MIQMGADWHQGRVSLWKYSYYVSVTGDLAVSPFKFVVSEELDSMLAKENEYTRGVYWTLCIPHNIYFCILCFNVNFHKSY